MAFSQNPMTLENLMVYRVVMLINEYSGSLLLVIANFDLMLDH